MQEGKLKMLYRFIGKDVKTMSNILCELLLTPHQLICHINLQQGLTNSPRGSRANWDRSELDIKADFNAKSKFHTMYSCVNTVYCCVK